jgi:hypothetical protein
MTGLISPGNRARIEGELLALGADGEIIQKSLSMLEFHASRFVRAEETRRNRSKRKHGPEKLLAQIHKVWNNTGPQREAAFRKAVEMGLDPESSHRFLRPFHDAALFLETEIETYYRYPGGDPLIANKAETHKRYFTAHCMVVWIKAGGEVRFTSIGAGDKGLYVDQPHDAGPLGRFLTAAQTDAYARANLVLPEPSGMRAMGRRMADVAYEWADAVD